ncbi:MAG TPA: hypothetical protein VIS99_11635, partial [Terrimicrobiaceae bacterium]
ARSDRQRRQWFQERNFGEAAVLHGFKRARWRGLWKQSIQDYLIAAIQNFKIIARRPITDPSSIRTPLLADFLSPLATLLGLPKLFIATFSRGQQNKFAF